MSESVRNPGAAPWEDQPVLCPVQSGIREAVRRMVNLRREVLREVA